MNSYLMTWRSAPYYQQFVIDFGVGQPPRLEGRLWMFGRYRECEVLRIYTNEERTFCKVSVRELDTRRESQGWIGITPLANGNLRGLYLEGAFDTKHYLNEKMPSGRKMQYQTQESAARDIDFFSGLEEPFCPDVAYAVVRSDWLVGYYTVKEQLRLPRKLLKDIVARGNIWVYQKNKWYGRESAA